MLLEGVIHVLLAHNVVLCSFPSQPGLQSGLPSFRLEKNSYRISPGLNAATLLFGKL